MTNLYSINMRYFVKYDGNNHPYKAEANLLVDADTLLDAVRYAESLPKYNTVGHPYTFNAFELDEDEQEDEDLREEAEKAPEFDEYEAAVDLIAAKMEAQRAARQAHKEA